LSADIDAILRRLTMTVIASPLILPLRGAKRRSNLAIVFPLGHCEPKAKQSRHCERGEAMTTQSFGLLAMTDSVEIATAALQPRNDGKKDVASQ